MSMDHKHDDIVIIDSSQGRTIDEEKGATASYNYELQKSSAGEKLVEEGLKLSSPSRSSEPTNSSAVEQEGEEIESTKVELGQVMQENQRLKQSLDEMMKDYQTLKRKFCEISQQQSKQPSKNINKMGNSPQIERDDDNEQDVELISLSLGRTSSHDSSTGKNSNKNELMMRKVNVVDEKNKCNSLSLELDYKLEALRSIDPGSSSSGEAKDGEVAGEQPRLPRKVHNGDNTRNGNGDTEDLLVQQPPVKKARVSVRARCDTPTMSDGCQWRKYGQKIAKGNPCPRAYYRCTVAPSCPVRKQVQRCADDMSILITTYEGTHNHPLPMSATTIASTTSAAAYMMMSGSSTSPNQGSHPSTMMTTTTTSTPPPYSKHGLNTFNMPNNNTSTSNNSFYLPNSTTFSPPPLHPTITLDLTSQSLLSSTNLSNTSNYNYNPSNLTFYNPSYNKTQFSINPLDHNNSSKNNPTSLNYSQFQNYIQKSVDSKNNNQDPSLDKIAQAAKVLTSDPSFQSVLTAALSSFINENNNNNVKAASIISSQFNAQKIKWSGDIVETNSGSKSTTVESANKGAS